jgi:hypothetical protein
LPHLNNLFLELEKEALLAYEEEERQAAAHAACMEKCVPAPMAAQLRSCQDKCKVPSAACMKKCLPAEVDKKVESCHQECHAQAPAPKPKEEEEQAETEVEKAEKAIVT